MKRYKIVNKKRFFAFQTFVLALIMILFSQVINRTVYSSVYQSRYIDIYVTEGDTLWTIAKDYLPEKTDIRKMIFDIKQFNNMETSYIYPGDTIKIPINE